MPDLRPLAPLVTGRMSTESLDALDATLIEWAGVPLHSATVDDLNAATRSLGLFRDAAINAYADQLAAAGMDDIENHANGDAQ